MTDISTEAALKKRIEVLEDRNERLRSAAGEFRRRVARLRSIIDTMPVGVSECNARGEITFANTTLARMTGYSEGEMVGKRVWDLMPAGIQRDTMPDYMAYLSRSRQGAASCVTRYRHRSGKLSDIQVEWSYRENDRGEVTGYTAIHTDIGDRMRVDETLREARTALKAQLADRTAELLRSYRLLEHLALSVAPHENGVLES